VLDEGEHFPSKASGGVAVRSFSPIRPLANAHYAVALSEAQHDQVLHFMLQNCGK
jgi:hypothetical protein